MQGTTAAVLQGLLLMTATKCVVSCIACVRIMWACHPEHNLNDSNPHFEFQKHPRSTAAVQQLQQRYTSEPLIANPTVYTTPPEYIRTT